MLLQDISNDKLQTFIDEALLTAGLLINPNQLIKMTPNKVYRCATAAKPKKTNGWLVLKHDGISEFMTMVYGNYESGDDSNFKYHFKPNNTVKKLTRDERINRCRTINAQKEADRIKYEQDKQLKANCHANDFIQLPICTEHAYADNKGINKLPLYGLKHYYRRRPYRDLLCIPFMNHLGVVSGYQTIAENGDKRFRGSVGGCYWQYPMSDSNTLIVNSNNSFFILCEGVATGISAYEAITCSFDQQQYLAIILCAFNVGNLPKVVLATKSKKLPYLYLVDNDSHNTRNAGIETCKALLQNHQDAEIYPLTFPNNADANDYISENGNLAFIRLIQKYANPISSIIEKDKQ